MARPVTLFTGQWADLPIQTLAQKAMEFGYDGIEIACWGDHFEVDRAASVDDTFRESISPVNHYGIPIRAVNADSRNSLNPRDVTSIQRVSRLVEATHRMGVPILRLPVTNEFWNNEASDTAFQLRGASRVPEPWPMLIEKCTKLGIVLSIEAPTHVPIDQCTRRLRGDSVFSLHLNISKFIQSGHDWVKVINDAGNILDCVLVTEPADALHLRKTIERNLDPLNAKASLCLNYLNNIKHSRRKTRLFTSYSHKDSYWAQRLMIELEPQLMPSRKHNFEIWKDMDSSFGVSWHSQIRERLTSCEVALLLLSPNFLTSEYIHDVEIARLHNSSAHIIPVLLDDVDLGRMDLHGLEEMPIFGLSGLNYKDRPFRSCRTRHQRQAFVGELARAIESRLSPTQHSIC